MPIVKTLDNKTVNSGAVSLPRYAQIIGYSECQFFGVKKDGDRNFACREIWRKDQRDLITRYLKEAQESIEQVIGYFLQETYVSEEQHLFKEKFLLDHCKIVATGIKAETIIASSAALDKSSDPSITASLETDAASIDEIRVYYPGTDIEIFPSDISLSGGFVTVSIPRCRTVKPELLDNPETGLLYTDLDNFLDAVDIKRVYTDTSNPVSFVYPSGYTGCSSSCDEQTASGCVYVIDDEIGFINVKPTLVTCYTLPELVRVNYLSGINVIGNFQAEDAIIRLAHSRMPHKPCGCETANQLWERDRFIPQNITTQRANCPFGVSDGAWEAWIITKRLKIYRSLEL